MTLDQIIALIVLVAVVGVMIHGRMRSDVVALSGAAALLLFGVVRPVEVQSAFASPAVIALAGLFVIAYAIELSGLLGLMIRKATGLCRRRYRRCSLKPSSGVMPRRFLWRYRRLLASLPT